jgi:hypothetical protein
MNKKDKPAVMRACFFHKACDGLENNQVTNEDYLGYK